MNDADTYLITLQFDPATFEWLHALRTKHFPLARNLVPAHLTLFHTVSRDQVMRMEGAWGEFEHSELPVIRFTGVRSLGYGTALVVESQMLSVLRSKLMPILQEPFTRQDQQRFRAHVTIQNKVPSASARQLLEEMSCDFVARQGVGRGLIVWRYLGGPWSLQKVLSFKA